MGITREVCFNAVRVGLYEPILSLIGSALGRGELEPSVQERMLAGFTCGALGGCCVNPIEVLKVRMQAQGGLTGHQHRFELLILLYVAHLVNFFFVYDKIICLLTSKILPLIYSINSPIDGLSQLLREEGVAGCIRGVGTSTL